MKVPLAGLRDVLVPAAAAGYAVGAFNAANMEYVQGILSGAIRESAPVIIQVSEGAIRYAGLECLLAVARVGAQAAPIPVVLHLDHGRSLELVRECIRRGFTSVMFDGSRMPLEENIRLTRQVVAWARAAGVSVEGEVGRVPSSNRTWTASELEELMTTPDEARRFAEETGVDALAVAVGSIHQLRFGRARLDIDRIRAIRVATGLPLVLHGSSGVEESDIRLAAREGIAKVNFATVLHEAFTAAARRFMESEPDNVDPRGFLAAGREAIANVVAEKVRLLGSAGKIDVASAGGLG